MSARRAAGAVFGGLLAVAIAGVCWARTVPVGSEAEAEIRRRAEAEPGVTGTVKVDWPEGMTAMTVTPGADARLTSVFGAAIEEIASTTSLPGSRFTGPAVPAADASEALRRYARGRDAALEQKWYRAITELEQAMRLDVTSVAIARELARCYLDVGNSARASEMYERVRGLDPGESESLLYAGIRASRRGQLRVAASALGPLVRDGAFAPGTAHAAIAAYELGQAFLGLGYDRAAIEPLEVVAVVTAPDPSTRPRTFAVRQAELARARGSVWRSIGDARARLGEFDAALDAWAFALEAGVSDRAALRLRSCYAFLRRGRPYSAQQQLLMALDDPGGGHRHVDLARYVAANAGSTDLLVEAVRARLEARPTDARLARVAAVLLPAEEAALRLRTLLELEPDNLDAYTELIGWFAADELPAAARLTIDLATGNPGRTRHYADRFILARATPGAIIASIEDAPPSPARAALLGHVLLRFEAVGAAYDVVAPARTQWPGDPALRSAMIAVAVDLGEIEFIDRLAAEMAAADAETAGEFALALLGFGFAEEAAAVAQAAMDRFPESSAAHLALARARVAELAGALDAAERGQRAQVVASVAERAIELDRQNDAAYELLLAMFEPRQGVAPDERLYRTVLSALRSSHPDGLLFQRLLAASDLEQGRYEAAIERLDPLCRNHPEDPQSLRLIIQAWTKPGRSDAAVEWVEGRLEETPSDPLLASMLASLRVSGVEGAEAVAWLEARLAADPQDHVARRLLETVLHELDRVDDAVVLAEQRLRRRPDGMHRAVELVALYTLGNRPVDAIEWLRRVTDRVDARTIAEGIAAFDVSRGLPAHAADRDQARHRLAARIVELDEAAPLSIYRELLFHAAPLETAPDRFAEIAARAAEHATAGGIRADASLWVALAQELVDAGYAGRAATALGARLDARGLLDVRSFNELATAMFTALAIADDVPASIGAIDRIAASGRLAQLSVLDAGEDVASALVRLAAHFSLVGNQPASWLLLEEALRRNPDHAMAMNNLGYGRVEAGWDDTATANMILRALVLAPFDDNVLDTAGWLRYRQGRFAGTDDDPGALELIEQAMRASPDPSPEVLEHLGDVRWRLDDRAGAIEAWRAAAMRLTPPGDRDRVLRNVAENLRNALHLDVLDPESFYHSRYEEPYERVSRKLRQVEAGEAPEVTPIFEELAGDR